MLLAKYNEREQSLLEQISIPNATLQDSHRWPALLSRDVHSVCTVTNMGMKRVQRWK